VQTVLTFVPVAFLITLPAEALLGRQDPTMLLLAPLVAIGAAVIARLAWRRSLRSPTGASA
jgi:ABC-2 type transport system permease protein